MDSTRPTAEPTISAHLKERIAAGDFPSAVYLVWERGRPVFSDALGHAVIEPYRIAVSLSTIYDIASLTKPLVTALLCSLRIDAGQFSLDDLVSDHLSEFRQSDKSHLTLRHLLAHTSGFPAWRPLYILSSSPDDVLSRIAAEPLEYETGTRVVYSDLGFITLGLLLERASGKPLPVLAREEIFTPLELKSTFFNPEAARQTGIAACEVGNAYEQNSCRETGMPEYEKWRKGIIWGEVHDGNAYFLGGSAGHAGLFSTATETTRIASQFLARYSILLKPATCELFKTNFTSGLNESRSVGWQLASTQDSTAGPRLRPDSFGHTGFTGTSCWIDPENERIFVLLTNRTHRALPFANINAVRRQFHTLAVDALERNTASKD
jgi:CubicO group peptidase (beta-lactamase class C family)